MSSSGRFLFTLHRTLFAIHMHILYLQTFIWWIIGEEIFSSQRKPLRSETCALWRKPLSRRVRFSTSKDVLLLCVKRTGQNPVFLARERKVQNRIREARAAGTTTTASVRRNANGFHACNQRARLRLINTSKVSSFEAYDDCSVSRFRADLFVDRISGENDKTYENGFYSDQIHTIPRQKLRFTFGYRRRRRKYSISFSSGIDKSWRNYPRKLYFCSVGSDSLSEPYGPGESANDPNKAPILDQIWIWNLDFGLLPKRK